MLMKPGPGAYAANSNAVSKTAPKFGFGSSTRETGNKMKNPPPGPGTYQSKDFTGHDGPLLSMGAILKIDSHKKE